MLPLHGQGTAAVEILFHWAGIITNNNVSSNNVFDKQSRYEFAEFL